MTSSSEVFQPLDLGTLSFDDAPFYKKVATVTARPAVDGEKIVTIMADGHDETKNTAKKGDYLVTNPSGEQYLVPGDKFLTKYQLVEGHTYAPIAGPVRVIFVTTNVAFIASWEEEQRIKSGGVIVNNQGSVYGIQGPEFAETYALCDEAGNLI